MAAFTSIGRSDYDDAVNKSLDRMTRSATTPCTGFGWKDRTDTVAVTKPDGQQYEATAQFNMSHFRPLDPKASLDKRWRAVVLLLNGKKEELPVGSKFLVSEDIRDAILPHNVA